VICASVCRSLRIRRDLGHDRLVHLLGKIAAHAPDAVAHLGGRPVRVAAEGKSYADLAQLLAAGGRHRADALDAGERVLQDGGDIGFHQRRGSAGQPRGHAHHRLVDVRIFANRQRQIGDRAEQQDQ
jgi:hypothetical protein